MDRQYPLLVSITDTLLLPWLTMKTLVPSLLTAPHTGLAPTGRVATTWSVAGKMTVTVPSEP